MVPDSLSKLIVDEIIKSISTGSDSDVKIFVKDISEVYDIGSRQYRRGGVTVNTRDIQLSLDSVYSYS